MKRIAVIGAILEQPNQAQSQFNSIVSHYKSIIRGRTGIPLEEGFAVISLIVCGTLDEINSLTGQIGTLENVSVKTAISKKEVH